MKNRSKSVLAAFSATLLMASTFGALLWLCVLMFVAFAERGLETLDFLPRHWESDHMALAVTIAAAVASLPIAWLAGWYFRAALRAERELSGAPRLSG